MATRSMIGKRNADGTITAIYCHWNGDIAGNGRMLIDHYTDPAKIDALLALGQISELRREIGESAEGHTYSTPHADWTIAYHRDRGNPLIIDTITRDAWPLRATEYDAEFVYLWDGVWLYACVKGFGDNSRFGNWRRVAESLKMLPALA